MLEDWLVHFTLPPVAYTTLLIAALLLQASPVLALFVGNGAILLLLFVGIHNAWDRVTFIAVNAQEGEEEGKNTSATLLPRREGPITQ